MGWLFGKKKTSRVPFPQPYSGEDILKFPTQQSSENIIEPNKLKEAAGLGQELPTMPNFDEESEAPEFDQESQAPNMQPAYPNPSSSPVRQPFVPNRQVVAEHLAPLYVKVDVYQRILGELESLNHDLSHLQTINEHLETSEYNEENNFLKLRRDIRVVHDRLLQMDKTLFKTQGE